MDTRKSKRARRQERVKADHEYFMVYEGRNYTGHTREISPFGAGVYSDRPLDPEKTVEFTIYIPESSFKLMVNGIVRSCIENHESPDESRKYIIGIEFTESRVDELPLIISQDQTTSIAPSHSVTIRTQAEKCYELSCDFDRFKEWSSGLEKLNVREKYPDGRAKVIDFVYNFHLRKANYSLEYSYDDANLTSTWKKVGGDKDLRNITGSFKFLPIDENLTTAIYSVELDISFIPSTRLVNWGTTIVMRMELRSFKKFVENFNS